MGRIIVVEDNIIYSDFVCRLLESKGYPSGLPRCGRMTSFWLTCA